MKLYNKIQELINESETLKQKNNEVLALARNELSELVKEKVNENLESLKNTFQGYLNGELVEMPLVVKKKC
ncbi:mitogen-activated protein kinase 1 [Helicobacter phage FrMEG235U]|nr:mitogen-activated protein kinase 1 [Helicobacter phage FrMEG235U]ANT43099.1 mitogen-activated protein kinase 1 [Helicobacter phage FrANT170U]